MKEHQQRELVNALRDIAKQYHSHDSLRDRLARALNEGLAALACSRTPDDIALSKPVYQIRHHRDIGWQDMPKPRYEFTGREMQATNLWERRVLYTTPATPDMKELHAFLNAAAGEGVIFDGVDAGDLYKAWFPERYASAVGGIFVG